MSESEHDDEIEAGFLAAYGERAATDVFADVARGGFRRGVEWERRRRELVLTAPGEAVLEDDWRDGVEPGLGFVEASNKPAEGPGGEG